ncbi:acid protease [Russula earlei]|uniref:Acid protease n=1 Tax=Russula earlei TaxID=71964 RepID=A0ACC0UQ25_9AGAM|nr:acid protease [Russula earlei]
MKFVALSYSLALCTAAALALKFPVKKISRHSLLSASRSTSFSSSYSPHLLASSSNPYPDSSDLSTINDMIYIANITLGGVDYHLQLDSGSSDLWVKSNVSPLPNSNPTYGIGWAFGHISYSTVQFSGITVPNQAFLDVSSAQNPTITYGASGIVGIGFTSLSNIDALVQKTGSSSGSSLLYNIFSSQTQEPNFIAVSLQRSTDPTADVQGTFLVGELDPQYAAVVQTPPIPTFPVSNPRRWNVLLEAVLVGNTAVALLDSGTSLSYARPDLCEAIYSNITGAQQDSQTGLWSIPCNVEIDVAIQINGQVFPLHPLDMVPKSISNPGRCVGSFVSQDLSAMVTGDIDVILGDNVLRSVYSVYDFGDFDDSGTMGNPYVKLLSLVDPDAASKDFAAARGSVARTNITYNVANSTVASPVGSTVSLSNDITDTLNKINTYFPIMLAILGLNALVILLLAIAAFIYIWRRHSASSAPKQRRAQRFTPMPLEAVSTDSLAPQQRKSMQPRSSRQAYEAVSAALTDDTVSPSPPSGGFDDQSNSVARASWH